MAAIDAGELKRPAATVGYKRVVLAFVVAAYTFNFIDRTIVSILGQAIKVDLKITDAQLGMLGGIAFAILYTLLGVPIARLAERFNRVSIISLAIVAWSAFTAACGLAGSFAVLLAMRVGVGIGEAGCSPPIHSLISDYFEPKRRASALAVYSFGIPLGAMIGSIAGGLLAKGFGWRMAFIVVGLPGLILAALIKLVVREPQRGASDPGGAGRAVAAPTGGELKEIGAVIATLFGNWPAANMMIAVTLASFAGYGVGQFSAPYFIRTFGLDYATVGLIFGLTGGLSAGLGTLAGGFISDLAARRHARWYALIPAIGLAIATPLYVLVYRVPDWKLAAAILLIPGAFAYTFLGPTFGVVQNLVEARRRATATAVMLLFLNIIALGGGPLFTGWIIDRFAGFYFTHPGAHSFLGALGGALGDGGGAARFASACPGGIAPAGSALRLAYQCQDAGALATRHGILVTFVFGAWAALHYLLASFGLAGQLAKTRR
ncbi:MAG TPA: MFS transporter [Caulobacteraceae bacterium]|jgi:predicted MFS family arabinose efflux permease|nr:MFS transporter [Caulobacteraceae bacterium]